MIGPTVPSQRTQDVAKQYGVSVKYLLRIGSRRWDAMTEDARLVITNKYKRLKRKTEMESAA